MKKIINKALKISFHQDSSLPQITTENLKTVLEYTLTKASEDSYDGPANPEKRNQLMTQVNTFLYSLSVKPTTCLIYIIAELDESKPPKCTDTIKNLKSEALLWYDEIQK